MYVSFEIKAVADTEIFAHKLKKCFRKAEYYSNYADKPKHKAKWDNW